MNKRVYLSFGSLITPIATSWSEHEHALKLGQTGIKKVFNSGVNGEDWYISKMEDLHDNRYNTLLSKAIMELKGNLDNQTLSSNQTLFIVSSTKGNIDALPEDVFESTRTVIKRECNNFHPIVIVSNACISGVIAVNSAADYIKYSNYKTVIIIGIDTVSNFIVNGFQSLYALSDEPAKPFDKNRKGITLGEACGIIIATDHKTSNFQVEYIDGASSNDANHISGPSRTGEGLHRVIEKIIQRSNTSKDTIDFISAHGTATLYNDEMESIAFNRSVLQNIPINSMKGYFGHTLGAAGILETMICMLSIKNQTYYKSLGFHEAGTSEPLAIIEETKSATINTVLKTASGFGGGNAALLLKKMQ